MKEQIIMSNVNTMERRNQADVQSMVFVQGSRKGKSGKATSKLRSTQRHWLSREDLRERSHSWQKV